MELLFGIFSAFGLSASAGLNAYIPLLIIAVIAHYTDWFTLNPPFDTLANPWVIIVLGVLVIIEFLADKIPAINHLNDILQTLIRPTAGAIVFAASAKVLTDANPVFSLICGLLIAGSVHVVKAGAVRPAVTATTAGAGNVPVSIAEDIISTLVSFLSIVMPVLIAVIFILLAAYIIWRLGRRAKINS
jgi:hypothetical protein